MDMPAHQLTMTVLMTPDMANFSGNVHGALGEHGARVVRILVKQRDGNEHRPAVGNARFRGAR